MTASIPNHPPEPASERRRPTIHDVARDAGVSKTSVSRYYGRERDLLSDTMIERIEAAIERLGFAPDRIASSLRGRRTGLIGVVVADMRNPYTVDMLHGAEQACRKHGYSLLVCNTGNDDQLERQHLEILHGYSVEGLLINTRGRNAATLAARQDNGLPMVLVDRHIDGLACDMVGLDNDQAVGLSVSHLVDQGYQRLLMITEPVAGISSREARIQAFQHQAQAAGVLAEVHEGLEETLDAAWLAATLEQWLKTSEAPGAIVCANGVITLAVCHALFALLKSPFDQVGLLGIDELAWCALVGPGITTVAQPVGDIGYSAIEALVHRISHTASEPQSLLFPAHLTPRGSTTLNMT
ncbi:LacI family DNA-binding transcriptional regulator [Kushneria indalinina]|uniref:LacI family transcriptional regulator n=1 Tax=Kushneria indalinina DSM 14324 TaxID=1122140 RepID=A0A3D9E0R2_9GAMM|nr:LacI family DNA-binding transcriptional regulator [Kushneria indalinina]REC96618.1 LacI family transcriptional regulator [Kushneria indalinina DSM 14324]